jgi:hypothetical protein
MVLCTRESTEGKSLELVFLQELLQYDSRWVHKGVGLCRSVEHFNHHRLSGRALSILYGHWADLGTSVRVEAEKLHIQLLCLPAHCSARAPAIGLSFFFILRNETGKKL